MSRLSNSNTRAVRKAVFPVAGLGTRFLPATKACPKEMLPIVDKPVIQYAVEEAIAAGIEEMIFVTGRSKRAIEDHFDASPELEAELEARGKDALLKLVRNVLPPNIKCVYVRQAQALGLGHAVLCAAPLVGNEPFAVLLADDLIDADVSVTKQLIDQYHLHGASVLGVEEVPREHTQRYGIVATRTLEGGEVIDGAREDVRQVVHIVEKPKPEDAPSTLAVVGRYVLEPEIFAELERTPRGTGGEIQLTDGIEALLRSRSVVACKYEGTRYDCGNKIGYWEANLMLGLRHPEIGAAGVNAVRAAAASLATRKAA
ncbi:MAG TPA: UTP--glucose-1-phosphate uridylyltransferase GalU [Burkholderiaceae bacterium]|nr:UTP--glucose-1-phosphate uridylyltransferase GalU [Burkholderiaceae bacterium]